MLQDSRFFLIPVMYSDQSKRPKEINYKKELTDYSETHFTHVN